jgi:hypothetical protein
LSPSNVPEAYLTANLGFCRSPLYSLSSVSTAARQAISQRSAPSLGTALMISRKANLSSRRIRVRQRIREKPMPRRRLLSR